MTDPLLCLTQEGGGTTEAKGGGTTEARGEGSPGGARSGALDGSDGSDDEFFDASEEISRSPSPRTLLNQLSGRSIYHDADEDLTSPGAHAPPASTI